MPSTEADAANEMDVRVKIIYIITIIINSITCPFVVALNVLVIMAVKTRPRLRTNSNILLACLAATDALTGLVVQPSFILYMMSLILGLSNSEGISTLHHIFLFTVLYSSFLHLMLVTFERLLAIKFTMRYSNVITKKNIKIAVTVIWITALILGMFRLLETQLVILRFVITLGLISCILFVVFSYIILYRETRRHQKMIKTQQLPQEEVKRFTQENKALQTTVYVVGAVIFCLLPVGVFVILLITGLSSRYSLLIWQPLARTAGILNSLLNPLIYCWRQKEVRKFVFGMRRQALQPSDQRTSGSLVVRWKD